MFIGRDDSLPNGKKIFSHILENCGGYTNRIFYHSTLEKEKLYPFVKNADAVLLPSRVDNYPNVCLEAQMLGKPVIGTYESSLDEMIEDGKTGFLANNSDVDSIIKAVERCLKQNDKQKKIMRSNIFSQINAFKNENRIGQLIDFYEETINNFMKNNKIKKPQVNKL